jgi:tRNA modification GTPase
MGIEVSEDYVRRAAIVLACGDSPAALRAACGAIRSALEVDRGNAPIVLVHTKTDLGGDGSSFIGLTEQLGALALAEVSAESGAGVSELVTTIGRALTQSVGSLDLDAPVLTQTRHRHAIARALDELALFRRAWREEGLPATIAAVHLHSAAAALQELIGVVDVEDVLDEVFRRFCVGK